MSVGESRNPMIAGGSFQPAGRVTRAEEDDIETLHLETPPVSERVNTLAQQIQPGDVDSKRNVTTAWGGASVEIRNPQTVLKPSKEFVRATPPEVRAENQNISEIPSKFIGLITQAKAAHGNLVLPGGMNLAAKLKTKKNEATAGVALTKVDQDVAKETLTLEQREAKQKTAAHAEKGKSDEAFGAAVIVNALADGSLSLSDVFSKDSHSSKGNLSAAFGKLSAFCKGLGLAGGGIVDIYSSGLAGRASFQSLKEQVKIYKRIGTCEKEISKLSGKITEFEKIPGQEGAIAKLKIGILKQESKMMELKQQLSFSTIMQDLSNISYLVGSSAEVATILAEAASAANVGSALSSVAAAAHSTPVLSNVTSGLASVSSHASTIFNATAAGFVATGAGAILFGAFQMASKTKEIIDGNNHLKEIATELSFCDEEIANIDETLLAMETDVQVPKTESQMELENMKSMHLARREALVGNADEKAILDEKIKDFDNISSGKENKSGVEGPKTQHQAELAEMKAKHLENKPRLEKAIKGVDAEIDKEFTRLKNTGDWQQAKQTLEKREKDPAFVKIKENLEKLGKDLGKINKDLGEVDGKIEKIKIKLGESNKQNPKLQASLEKDLEKLLKQKAEIGVKKKPIEDNIKIEIAQKKPFDDLISEAKTHKATIEKTKIGLEGVKSKLTGELNAFKTELGNRMAICTSRRDLLETNAKAETEQKLTKSKWDFVVGFFSVMAGVIGILLSTVVALAVIVATFGAATPIIFALPLAVSCICSCVMKSRISKFKEKADAAKRHQADMLAGPAAALAKAKTTAQAAQIQKNNPLLHLASTTEGERASTSLMQNFIDDSASSISFQRSSLSTSATELQSRSAREAATQTPSALRFKTQIAQQYKLIDEKGNPDPSKVTAEHITQWAQGKMPGDGTAAPKLAKDKAEVSRTQSSASVSRPSISLSQSQSAISPA